MNDLAERRKKQKLEALLKKIKQAEFEFPNVDFSRARQFIEDQFKEGREIGFRTYKHKDKQYGILIEKDSGIGTITELETKKDK